MERRNDRHFASCCACSLTLPPPLLLKSIVLACLGQRDAFPLCSWEYSLKFQNVLWGGWDLFLTNHCQMESKSKEQCHTTFSRQFLWSLQNNSLVSFPFFELSSAVTIMRGGRRNLFGDWRRERDRERRKLFYHEECHRRWEGRRWFMQNAKLLLSLQIVRKCST